MSEVRARRASGSAGTKAKPDDGGLSARVVRLLRKCRQIAGKCKSRVQRKLCSRKPPLVLAEDWTMDGVHTRVEREYYVEWADYLFRSSVSWNVPGERERGMRTIFFTENAAREQVNRWTNLSRAQLNAEWEWPGNVYKHK